MTLIERIAAHVADDGTDYVRVALADQIRSHSWLPDYPLEAWDAVREVIAELSKVAAALRQEAAESCAHPPERVREYEWHHGYGKYVTGLRCMICDARKSFPSQGYWSRPEDHSDDRD